MSHEQVEVKTAAPLHLQQWRVQLLFLLWLMLYRTSHTWYTSFGVSILLPCFLILLLSLSYLNKDVFLGLLLQLEWLKSELCKHVLFAYFLSLFLSIPHFVILRLLCALECSIHSYMQSFAIFLQCFFPFCMLYNSPAVIS